MAADPAERELLVAIARQALDDLAGCRASRERHRARRWVLASSDDAFSFRWICDRLGIDAEAACQAVLRRESHTDPRVGA